MKTQFVKRSEPCDIEKDLIRCTSKGSVITAVVPVYAYRESSNQIVISHYLVVYTGEW